MRDDMSKVLVTRGRGGAMRLRRFRNQDLHEDPPRRQGMSMNRGTKYFGEHLGPLRRFLQSRVGQPWDDVYREIRGGLKGGGVVQEHVLFHLWRMIWTKVERVDGRLMGHDQGYYREVCWRRFYVCPDTRRLRRSPRNPGRPHLSG